MKLPIKSILRSIFAPLLNFFEGGDQAYAYKPSHRLILLVMSGMFIGLAALVAAMIINFTDAAEPGYLLPVLLFGGAGSIGLVVGCLGTDRAVAKIWGSK
jgi:hypothetical protein